MQSGLEAYTPIKNRGGIPRFGIQKVCVALLVRLWCVSGSARFVISLRWQKYITGHPGKMTVIRKNFDCNFLKW